MTISGRRAVVVGGGLIGLACGWRLLHDGWQVQILDGAPGAREASWAAAGMLAPHNEVEVAAEGPPHLWRLACASLARWPDFARELGIALDTSGSLVPILDAADAAEIAGRQGWLAAHGIACERWTAAEVAAREPALASCFGALALPGGRVDPRRACQALVERLAAAGCPVQYGSAVAGITTAGVTLADGGWVAADLVVVASGAWTPELARLSGLALAGEPVKGQMLRFAVDPGLERFVHCRHAYLVPRPKAGLIVGSTMVWDGFDRSGDPAAIRLLAEGARRLLPALGYLEPVETWTGLRPRLAGGLPCIDLARPGLIVASGHFRNGILLAPITSDLVADLAAGRPTSVDPTPFRLPRQEPFAPLAQSG